MGPLSPNAPFSMSADAALWAVEQLRAADAHAPKIAGKVPVLAYVLNCTRWKGGGPPLERVPYPHYRVWWLDSKEVDVDDGMWIEFFERRIFVQHPTLEELRGKRLTLQKVESTLAAQQGATRCVLRADPEQQSMPTAAG